MAGQVVLLDKAFEKYLIDHTKSYTKLVKAYNEAKHTNGAVYNTMVVAGKLYAQGKKEMADEVMTAMLECEIND